MSDQSSQSSVRHVTVSEDRAGQRLDNFLIGLLGQVPRSLVYRLVRTGQVRINGSRAKPMKKLAAGDEVRVPPVREQPPADRKLPDGLVETVRRAIIHRDDDMAVIDKPAGLAMHAGSGLSFGLVDAVARIGPDWRPVHRLDRPTSGLLIFACHHQALVALQREMTGRRINKRYLALLSGDLKGSSAGENVPVDAPLKKIRDGSGQRRIIVDPDGQSARSNFRVLERFDGFTLAEVSIETGRTHQIRAHAVHLGCPVAGDELYNPGPPPAGLDRMFLHAHFLGLSWPEDREFHAPLPAALESALTRLRAT